MKFSAYWIIYKQITNVKRSCYTLVQYNDQSFRRLLCPSSVVYIYTYIHIYYIHIHCNIHCFVAFFLLCFSCEALEGPYFDRRLHNLIMLIQKRHKNYKIKLRHQKMESAVDIYKKKHYMHTYVYIHVICQSNPMSPFCLNLIIRH